jgi:hypothetical protein
MIDSVRAAPDAVFRIWNNRLKIELEAAHLFSQMAHDLRLLYGADDSVAKMSEAASSDERRHAVRCQEIVNFSRVPLVLKTPIYHSQMGPATHVQDRLSYACVAVGCVTETLSTALLIEMRKRAAPGIIHNTISEILIDEIDHSRIGWAELARVAKSRDVSWLSQHIPAMINEALQTDVRPILNKTEKDLSEWGILPPTDARAIMTQTLQEVIAPGLCEYGIAWNA